MTPLRRYMTWHRQSYSRRRYHTPGYLEKDNASIHYVDIIRSLMASQITSLRIAYSTVYSGADQRKHQIFASLAFVRGIHWGPVNSLHKLPVTRKMLPSDDVIMY